MMSNKLREVLSNLESRDRRTLVWNVAKARVLKREIDNWKSAGFFKRLWLIIRFEKPSTLDILDYNICILNIERLIIQSEVENE